MWNVQCEEYSQWKKKTKQNRTVWMFIPKSIIAKWRGHPCSKDEWADGWEKVADARFTPQMPGFLIRYLTEAFLFHSPINFPTYSSINLSLIFWKNFSSVFYCFYSFWSLIDYLIKYVYLMSWNRQWNRLIKIKWGNESD